MAPVTPIIRQLALQRRLDPAAVLAVAQGEGGLVNREGDIGDLSGGGSYGPFQLYTKGALPAQYRGRPQAADQWAWSPQGIAYALDQMVKVGAAGLRGPAAVNTIIRKFERPYDPNKSVKNALARLGSSGGGLQAVPTPNAAMRTAASAPMQSSNNPRRNALLRALVGGEDIYSAIQKLPGIGAASSPVVPSRQASPIPVPSRPGMPTIPARAPIQTGKGIRELIYDPVGSIFDGVRSNKPYGGHGGHLHFAGSNAQQMLHAIALARQLGLSVRENPYTDPVDPVHTKNSHHYQLFPGKHNGRSLGQAADISGNPKALRTLYQRLAALG